MRIAPMRSLLAFVAAGLCACTTYAQQPDGERMRIRDLGIEPGVMRTGPLNAITDVAGVRVGHETLIAGDNVRTGVTAILPHGGDVFLEKSRAAVFTGNGYGKAAGFEQVRELGEIESPVVLTNTLNVGTVVAAVQKWTLQQSGHENVRSVNAVVGETNDGFLNDIRGQHVSEAHVFSALAAATAGPVAEGNVGAGTGTATLGFKGGIGTSSRVLPVAQGGYTVGVLAQTNFGGTLLIDGMRAGEALDVVDLAQFRDDPAVVDASVDGGSVMIVVATDAPVDARNLERMAKRAPLGLARVGSWMGNGSGDFVIAFSTANRIDMRVPQRTDAAVFLRNDGMGPLFLATVEAVEEAVLNAMSAAGDMTGRDGNTLKGLPLDKVRDMAAARKDGG